MLPGVFKCDLRMQSDNDKSSYSLLHFSDLNYLFSFKQTHAHTQENIHSPLCTSPLRHFPASRCLLISMYRMYARTLIIFTQPLLLHSVSLFHLLWNYSIHLENVPQLPRKCLECNLIQMVLTHLCNDTTFIRNGITIRYFQFYMFGSMHWFDQTSRISRSFLEFAKV